MLFDLISAIQELDCPQESCADKQTNASGFQSLQILAF